MYSTGRPPITYTRPITGSGEVLEYKFVVSLPNRSRAQVVRSRTVVALGRYRAISVDPVPSIEGRGMIRAMVRRESVFLAVVGFGLLSAVPADAATPAFEFDVEARRGSVVVTVTFEPVPPGFNWAA
jgi:hypothetical protein